jgi:LuxR family maltose regulon positive regulatory protein
VTRTKVGPSVSPWTGAPSLPSRFLVRDRVMQVLDHARSARVVCLQAPGGYGKTTAMAQWLADDPRPVVWLPVRAAAADAPWLAQALVDALADAGLVAERVVLGVSAMPESWHLSTLPLIEELISHIATPFVVAIDDVGAVTGTAWACLLESVATSLPVGSQLMLTTREAVPPTLWRLESRGDLAVIGPRTLAFDEVETHRLLEALDVSSSADRVHALLAQTEGWPVAVYLAAQPLQSSTAPPIDVALPGQRGFAEYLREDIVARLSPDDATFLSMVSILSVLDAEACDSVGDVTNSLFRLRRIAAENQLVVPLDTTAERFRMHPLLADALSEHLREDDPHRWRTAHARASVTEEDRGDLDSAVHHAQLSGDDRRLARLVWSHTPFMLGSGRWAVLQRWIVGLDDDQLQHQCGLALTAAWVASHVGDMARMNRYSLSATESARRDDLTCLLDADLLSATIGTDGLASMEGSARAFINGKPRDDPWQTLSHFLLGVALFLRDEPDQAVAALAEGYRLAIAHNLPVMTAHCLAGLADAAFERGDEHQAVTFVREARALAAHHRIDAIATTAPIFTTSTVGFLHEGRFADARREAVRALRLTAMMRTMAPWHAVQGRLALAQVNAALGDPQRAKLLLDEAGDARGPNTASPRLERMYAETRERLATVAAGLDDASSLTTAEVRVLQYLPTHLSFPQIAEELFVSRHTVKTQALSAYRKLGVHTRSEAIERARRAGLLPPADHHPAGRGDDNVTPRG